MLGEGGELVKQDLVKLGLQFGESKQQIGRELVFCGIIINLDTQTCEISIR